MKIKKSWKEVSIKEYEQITKIKTDIELVKLLTDIENPETLTFIEFSEILNKLQFILTPPNGKLQKEYIIKGVKYKSCYNPRTITAGQFIDLQTYMTNASENIHRIMSVVLIPEKHKYNQDYDIVELQDIIYEEFNIEDALAFFLHYKILIKKLEKYSRDYLESQMKKLIQKKRKRKEETSEEEVLLYSLKDGDEFI